MTEIVEIRVVGVPRPQPRPRACRRGAHAGVYDPGTADAWKDRIALAASRHRPTAPLEGPLAVDVAILFPRPLSHFVGGRRDRGLRPGIATWHAVRPDRDNLDKAVLDTLTAAGFWTDDGQVADGRILKRYARPGEAPGCLITIRSLDDAEETPPRP